MEVTRTFGQRKTWRNIEDKVKAEYNERRKVKYQTKKNNSADSDDIIDDQQ